MKLKQILYGVVVVLMLLAPVAIVSVTGCKSSVQQSSFNTIYSVQKSSTAAYDSYLDLVISGQVKTNDLPRVAKAYNSLQASVKLALDVVQFNTNALAPPNLVVESQDLLNLIATLTRK